MKESTCHDIVIYLSQRFNMLCFVCLFLNFFFISFKYDLYVDAERLIEPADYQLQKQVIIRK